MKNRVSTSLRFPFAYLANKRRKVVITPDYVNDLRLVGPQQVLARAKAFIRNRVETAYRAYPVCRPIQEWVRQARQHELLKKVTGET